MKNPKTDLPIYGNLIYDHISRERIDFPIKGTKTIGYSYRGRNPKLGLYLTVYPKSDSHWIKDLNRNTFRRICRQIAKFGGRENFNTQKYPCK